MKLFSRKKRRRKKTAKLNERFATRVVVLIGITTAIFIAAQYVSFLITGTEQTTLIEKYFDAVVIECGALMLKRIAEVITARVKKKEGLNTTENESEGL